MKMILFAMLAGLAVTACGQKETPAQMLSAHGWTLKEVVVAGNDFTETPPEGVSIAFADSTDTASGRGGCNRFSAPYKLGDGGAITIGQAAVTRMMCPDSEFESRYLGWLAGVDRFEVTKEELRLVATAAGATLVYRPEFKAAQ